MPNLVLSGEVFSLDASAGFDEGIIRGDVGASARLSFDTQLTGCHGLAVKAAAQAKANANANLQLFGLISGDAEGAALAAAGAELVARATVDPFDSAGLKIGVAAYAEAAVAGKLAISLDLQDVARLASARLDGPALEIFLSLLGEVKVGAGVWARIAAAAMAQGRVSLQLSLADDEDAGFLIEASLAAGMGAGMGIDFYAGAKFESPKRFFLNAVDTLVGAIAIEARQHLPSSLNVNVAALEFALPAVLNASYEIAQIPPAELLARPATAAEAFASCFAAELQRFVLDKLALGSASLIAKEIDAVAWRLASASLTNAQRQVATTAISAAIDCLQDKTLTLTSVTEVLPKLVEVLNAIDASGRTEWRQPLAALWLCLAAADAFRKGIVTRRTQSSAGVIGLMKQVSPQVMRVEIKDVPQFVQDELRTSLGLAASSLSFDSIVEWLVDSKLLPQLRVALPEVTPLLDLIEHELDISDVLTAALRGDIQAAYRPCRALAARVLDELLINCLLPEIKQRVPRGLAGRIWTEEVAQPSLTLIRDFVLARLDDAAAGRFASQEPLRAALGLLVGQIVIRNVVVFQDILVDHIRDSVAEAARDLSNDVRKGDRAPLIAAFSSLTRPLLPIVNAVIPPDVLEDASRELAADLLLVLASATGEQVWNEARRARERDALRRILLSVYGEVDSDNANTLMAQVAACSYLPAPQAVIDMVGLQAEVVAATMVQTLPAAVEAAARFFARIADAAIDEIEVGLADGVRRLRDEIVIIGRRLAMLGRLADAQLAQAERFARSMQLELRRVADACRSPTRRSEILRRLRRQGEAQARSAARSAPGFGILSTELKALALAGATNAFRTAFNLVKDALDGVLQVLSVVGDAISNLFAKSADFAGFLRRLTQTITDEVEKAVRALANLELPAEIPIRDIIGHAVSVLTELIRDALTAAFGARQKEKEARAKHRSAIAGIARERQLQEAKKAAFDLATAGGAVKATICSPRGVESATDVTCAYHTTVPIRLVLGGIAATSAGAMDGKVALFLNGHPLSVPRSAWQKDQGRFRLTHELTVAGSALRPGLNVLECACASAGRPAVRITRSFLVTKSPPSDGVTVSVANGAVVVRVARGAAPPVGWRVIDSTGRVSACNLQPGVPTPIGKLVPMVGIRPGLTTPVITTPVIPLGKLPPCLSAITLIDAAGRHRLDYLTGDDK
jgi:hypothetical protein